MHTHEVSRTHVSPRGLPAHACWPHTHSHLSIYLPYSFRGNTATQLLPYVVFTSSPRCLSCFLCLSILSITPLRNFLPTATLSQDPAACGAYPSPLGQGACPNTLAPGGPPLGCPRRLLSPSWPWPVLRLRPSPFLVDVSLWRFPIPLVRGPSHPHLDPVAPLLHFLGTRLPPLLVGDNAE